MRSRLPANEYVAPSQSSRLLSEKNMQVYQLRIESLAARELTLAGREEELRYREGQLLQREQALLEKENTLASREADVLARELQLSRRESAVVEFENTMPSSTYLSSSSVLSKPSVSFKEPLLAKPSRPEIDWDFLYSINKTGLLPNLGADWDEDLPNFPSMVERGLQEVEKQVASAPIDLDTATKDSLRDRRLKILDMIKLLEKYQAPSIEKISNKKVRDTVYEYSRAALRNELDNIRAAQREAEKAAKNI